MLVLRIKLDLCILQKKISLLSLYGDSYLRSMRFIFILFLLIPIFYYMKTLICVHKDGRFFVAEDVVTNVADQGLTEKEAVSNLRKGLEEHYKLLMELMQ